MVGMLFELIGLKIIFDVDLRDVGKTPRWDMDILSLPRPEEGQYQATLQLCLPSQLKALRATPEVWVFLPVFGLVCWDAGSLWLLSSGALEGKVQTQRFDLEWRNA